MASVCTYLNFTGNTEEAFEFYKSVFSTDYAGSGLMRMGDIPAGDDAPELSAADKKKVMHVALPTVGDHMLMGTDLLESLGQSQTVGDNVSIMIIPDSHDDADELFVKLSDGASNVMPMQNMFWGDYFGSLRDKFGINWMVDLEGHKR